MGIFVGFDAWFNTYSLVEEKQLVESLHLVSTAWYDITAKETTLVLWTSFHIVLSIVQDLYMRTIHGPWIFYVWKLSSNVFKIWPWMPLFPYCFQMLLLTCDRQNFSFCLQLGCSFVMYKGFFNHLNPISDKNRISPYNINTIPSRQVTRIEKSIN